MAVLSPQTVPFPLRQGHYEGLHTWSSDIVTESIATAGGGGARGGVVAF